MTFRLVMKVQTTQKVGRVACNVEDLDTYGETVAGWIAAVGEENVISIKVTRVDE